MPRHCLGSTRLAISTFRPPARRARGTLVLASCVPAERADVGTAARPRRAWLARHRAAFSGLRRRRSRSAGLFGRRLRGRRHRSPRFPPHQGRRDRGAVARRLRRVRAVPSRAAVRAWTDSRGHEVAGRHTRRRRRPETDAEASRGQEGKWASGRGRRDAAKASRRTTRHAIRTSPTASARLALSNSPEAIAGAIRALMTRPDSTPLLRTIHCPTLIVVGAEDTLTPPSLSEEMHRAIAGSELVIIARRRTSVESRTAGCVQCRPRGVPDASGIVGGIMSFATDRRTSLDITSASWRCSRWQSRRHAQQPSTALGPFDVVLDTYVRDGYVYYRALKSDRRRLDELRQFARQRRRRQARRATSRSRSG